MYKNSFEFMEKAFSKTNLNSILSKRLLEGIGSLRILVWLEYEKIPEEVWKSTIQQIILTIMRFYISVLISFWVSVLYYYSIMTVISQTKAMV